LRFVLFAIRNLNEQVKEDESDGACSTHRKKRNGYRLWVRKPVGKRPLGRPRRRWVDNIKMDLGEIGWGGVSRLEKDNYELRD
jgi:hypothetical protein